MLNFRMIERKGGIEMQPRRSDDKQLLLPKDNKVGPMETKEDLTLDVSRWIHVDNQFYKFRKTWPDTILLE